MIIDNLKNAHLYSGMNEGIAKGLKFLAETDFSKMEPGKYEIDGRNLYYMVQEYSTKALEDGRFEAHRQYIDIQYIAEGAEKVGYTNISKLKTTEEYEDEKDVEFFDGSGDFVMLSAGYFGIFAPEDAHMPCISLQEQLHVRKVVVKVLI